MLIPLSTLEDLYDFINRTIPTKADPTKHTPQMAYDNLVTQLEKDSTDYTFEGMLNGNDSFDTMVNVDPNAYNALMSQFGKFKKVENISDQDYENLKQAFDGLQMQTGMNLKNKEVATPFSNEELEMMSHTSPGPISRAKSPKDPTIVNDDPHDLGSLQRTLQHRDDLRRALRIEHPNAKFKDTVFEDQMLENGHPLDDSVQEIVQNQQQNVPQPKVPVNPNDIVVSNTDLFNPNNLVLDNLKNPYGSFANLKNAKGRPPALTKAYTALKNNTFVNPNVENSQNIKPFLQVGVNNLEDLTNNLQQQNAQQPSPQNILSHINLKNLSTPTSYNTLNTTDFGKINSNNVNPVDTSVHHFYAKNNAQNNAQNNFDFEAKGSRDTNPQHQQQIPLQDLAQGVKKAATNNGPEKVEAEFVTPGQEYGTNNNNNNNNNTFNGRQRFAWWSQNPQQNDPTGNNTVYGTAAASAPPGGPGDLTGMFNKLKQGNLAGQYAPQINTMAAIGQGVGALSNISKLSQGASNLDDLRGQVLNSYSAANAPYYNLDPSQMSKIRRLQRGYTDADKPGLGDAVSNIGSSLPSILMQAGAGFMSGGVPGAIINGIGGAVNAGLEGVNKKQQQKAAELESLYGSLMQANASINNRRMMQQPYIY